MIKTCWINIKGTEEADDNIEPVSNYDGFEVFLNHSVSVAVWFAPSSKEKSRSSLRWRLILR